MIALRSTRETCANRTQLIQQFLELGFARRSRPVQTSKDAATGGLPEAGGVKQLDDEEEPIGGLNPFTDLAEQMGLA